MGLLVVTTPPTQEPVSLAEVRAHCRVTSNDEDGLIAGYLIAARTHVENVTGRALISRTYDQKYDAGWPSALDGSKEIRLRMPPLVSVTSVSYVDTNGTTQVLATDQYQVVLANVYGRIVEAYGVTWPSVRNQPDAVTVRFVAGFGSNPGDAPEPIRQAILMLVGHYYQNRETVSVGTMAYDMPQAVQALLSGYVADLL